MLCYAANFFTTTAVVSEIIAWGSLIDLNKYQKPVIKPVVNGVCVASVSSSI